MVEKTFVYPGGSQWTVCKNLKIKKILISGLLGQSFNLYSNDTIYGTIILGYSNQCSLDLTKTDLYISKIICTNIQDIPDVSHGMICTITIFYEED